MLIAGAASQASECTTVMSPIDPGQNNDAVVCKRVALLPRRMTLQIGSQSNEL